MSVSVSVSQSEPQRRRFGASHRDRAALAAERSAATMLAGDPVTTDSPSPEGRRARALTFAAAALTGALLLAGVAAMAARNLGYAGMWWDESASFWNSQGLSRYAEQFAPRRGWRDVVRINRAENLDPGGHTALLYLWTLSGAGVERLRSLSLLFLVVSCVALGVLGYRLTGAVTFALAAAAVPLLYPAARYFGFEIRAYSMEMAGVAVAALLLALAAERPTLPRLALLGTVLAAFLSSRYSFAFTVAAVAVALVWVGRRRGDSLAATATRLAVVALPVAVAGSAITWVTLRLQRWPDMREGPLGVSAPIYTRGAVLGASADMSGLLRADLIAPAALPITLAIVLFLAWRCCGNRVSPRLGALYVMVLAVQASSAAASVIGLYPWDLRSRWSAYLVMVSAVAAVTVAADLTALVRSYLGRPGTPPGLVRAASYAGAAAAALVVALGAAAAASHRQSVESVFRTDVPRQLELLPFAALADGSVLVTFYEVPVVRYLYEHGPFRGRPEYPGVFRFEAGIEYGRQLPIDAAAEGIRFVVTGMRLQQAQARLPGALLTAVEPAGGFLLAVTLPTPLRPPAPDPGGR